MKNSKISVALATYNGVHYLRDQLDSIIGQTLIPDEIIISDDHSTDGTLEVLKLYQEKGLIKFFLNPNKGLISNFKNAVANCSTENYIALSDQDDIWVKNKLEANYSAIIKIEHKDVPALVFSDLAVVDKENNLIYKSFFKEIVGANPKNEKLESLIFSNKVIGCTTLFNKVSRKYFDEMPVNACMHDYWIALICFTLGTHYYISTPLVRYRRHSNNVTDTNNSISKKIIKELMDYLFNKRIQLDEHIQTVELFNAKYGPFLNKKQRHIIEKFLKLKRSATVIKRLTSFYYSKLDTLNNNGEM